MKLLILTYSTGDGHNAAAEAIYEKAVSLGHDAEIAYSGEYGKDKKLKLADKFYINLLKYTPSVFGAIYKLGEVYNKTKIVSPVYLANKTKSRKLLDYVQENNIEAIICTHLYPMETITACKKKGKLNIPCYGVMTDYTYIPFTNETKLEGYFLAHESLKDEYVKKGVDSDRIYATSIPVKSKFADNLSKEQARNYLVIPNNRKVYLIMSGGVGCGNIVEICDKVNAKTEDDALIYVLVGRNDQIKEKIAKKFGCNSKIWAVTFTDKVNLYMKAADVLITKPGGLTSTEAAVAGVPIVHLLAMQGCETKNAKLFEKYGMSKFAHSTDEAVEMAVELANNPDLSSKMIEMQAKNINANASLDIIKVMENDTRHD